MSLFLIFFSSVSGIFSIYYILKYRSEFFNTYHYQTLYFWLILLFAFIASFILVGGEFFLPLNVPIFFRSNLHEYIIYFILVILIFINSITSIELLNKYGISILKKYAIVNDKNISKSDVHKTFWQSFVLFIAISLIFWLIFYPGRMSPDSLQVLDMIKSNQFNSHHTVLYPFINQILWTISRIFTSTDQGATAFLTFIPLISFSIIYSLWLTFLYQKGFSKTFLMISFALFYISPINSLQMVFLWKDIPYTQALFLLSYCFILFYTTDKYRESFVFLIGLGLLLSLILMIRFNGVGVVLFSLFLLFVCSIQIKNWKFIYVPLVTITFCLIFINVVIFNAWNFRKNTAIHMSGLILNTVNTAYLYGKEDHLHPEILKLTQQEGFDQDMWREARFNYVTHMYWASDTNKHKKNFDKVVNELTKDNKTWLKYYLYSLNNIPLFIRTRLNFIQTSWSISGEHTLLTYNTKADKLLRLWNIGLITILLLFYGLYCAITKKYLNTIILFPWITNLAVLFLVSQATDFRYFWICNWTALVAFFLIFIPIKNQKQDPI